MRSTFANDIFRNEMYHLFTLQTQMRDEVEQKARGDTTLPEIELYRPKVRKSGTGCVTMINEHLFEGRYTSTNAYGKRDAHNIYAKTREEYEEKLAAMIVEIKAKIKAEKELLKESS